MSAKLSVKLSPAAVSALECRGRGEVEGVEELVVKTAWCGSRLVFYEGEREALFSALDEMSNAEDAFAEEKSHCPEGRKLAGRAARSLAAVAGKVLRA